MASKKRRSRRRRSYRRRSRSRNPFRGYAMAPRRKSYRRRRNPAVAATVRELGGLILWGTTGAVAARVLPQMFLKGSNSGVMGYLANVGVTLIGGSLIGRFAGASAGAKFTAGGAIATGLRIFTDVFGAKALDYGLSGDLDFDLGFYLPNQFPLPTTGTGPYLLQPGMFGSPMAAGGMPGLSPIAQITPAPGALTPSAPGNPAVVPDEPGRWGSRWAA